MIYWRYPIKQTKGGLGPGTLQDGRCKRNLRTLNGSSIRARSDPVVLAIGSGVAPHEVCVARKQHRRRPDKHGGRSTEAWKASSFGIASSAIDAPFNQTPGFLKTLSKSTALSLSPLQSHRMAARLKNLHFIQVAVTRHPKLLRR
jgi:hypothetical protein